MSLIWSVCKDPGGTNGVVPVVKQLRIMGHDVKLIANGKALELLPKLNEECFTIEQALEVSPEPEALVTSMCSKGGVGRNLVPLVSAARIPIVALQDFWGAQLQPEFEDLKFRPEYICVNDEVGADIVQRAWPEFGRDRIIVTGFPAMDKYANYDVGGTSKKVMESLGIPHGSPVVVYCDQIDFAGQVLGELVEALNLLGRKDLYFIPRMHPRLPNDDPAGFVEFKNALKLFKGGTLIEDSSKCATSEVIAAATVVLSMYSTVNIEASCIRKQNISILYHDLGMALFLQGTGGLMDDFPLVSLGCSAKVTNRAELVSALARSLDGNLGLREA